jgi:hypothetical protein
MKYAIIIWFKDKTRETEIVDPIYKLSIEEDQFVISNSYHEYSYDISEIENITFSKMID